MFASMFGWDHRVKQGNSRNGWIAMYRLWRFVLPPWRSQGMPTGLNRHMATSIHSKIFHDLRWRSKTCEMWNQGIDCECSERRVTNKSGVWVALGPEDPWTSKSVAYVVNAHARQTQGRRHRRPRQCRRPRAKLGQLGKNSGGQGRKGSDGPRCPVRPVRPVHRGSCVSKSGETAWKGLGLMPRLVAVWPGLYCTAPKLHRTPNQQITSLFIVLHL